MKEATAEMRARLKAYFDITAVEIQTVHAFGREIIQAQERYVEFVDEFPRTPTERFSG